MPDSAVDPWEDYFKSLRPQQPAAGSAPGPGAANTLMREGGILGTHMLAPGAGLLHNMPGIGNYVPSYDQVLAMGPTPQGKAENILAAAGTAGGYALPLAALSLGWEAAALPEALTGGELLANTIRPAATALLSSMGGGAAGEARRQYKPDMPLGPLVDLGLDVLSGTAGGRMAGSMIGPAYGTTAPAAAGVPAATLPRLGIAQMLGGAVDWAGRHFASLPAGLSYWLGQGSELLAARGLPRIGGGGLAPWYGATFGGLTPTPTNP